MNWGGMPIGFRFYVKDFSLQTKQRCWTFVLKALEYADWGTMTLHETESQELFDPNQKVYIAVIGTKAIKVSRKNAICWREDAGLMKELCLYWPWIQENYMELYAPTHRLAVVEPDGKIIPDGEEGAFLKGTLVRRKAQKPGGRQLVWGESEEQLEERMDAFIKEHPGQGARRVLLTKGTGMTLGAAAFREGKLHTILLPDGKGGEGAFLFALLPDNVLLVDARMCPGKELPFSAEYGIGRFLTLAESWKPKKIFLCTNDESLTDIPANLPVTVNPSLEQIYHLRQALRACTGIYLKDKTDIFENLDENCAK